MRVLVTGATGYIGGRLIPELLEKGHRVRVLVRDPQRLSQRPWTDQVETVVADLSEPLPQGALGQDIEAAFYLVHSMTKNKDFSEVDRRCAQNFCQAARGIAHIIYLGGLLPEGDGVSTHLGSRAEVGKILADSLPVTEFRAGPIIGSGSASFEMVRYLTERVPLMLTPKWVKNEVQPVGIRSVLEYLAGAVEKEPLGVVEIGANRLTFRQMMEQYAEIRGLKRTVVPLPVLAPRLAALWVGLVTPIPNSLAVPLVEGVVHPVVADTQKARELFPDVHLQDYDEACRRALVRTEEEAVVTRWSNSLKGRQTFKLEDQKGTIKEVRQLEVRATPTQLFRAFTSIGGKRGWLTWEWAWRVRGLLDQLVGGPGLRRGRRDSRMVVPGDALDFWRVETVETDRRLVLRAEMKVPGKAWLVWESLPAPGGSTLVQTALFQPHGLLGVLYWYSLYPIHRYIFSDLARAIADLAEAE